MKGDFEDPIDHPSLTKYPNKETMIVTIDGVSHRVPLGRDSRDEAVPVIVNDLVAARGALHQFKKLIDSGAGDDFTIQIIGEVIVAGTNEPAPQTRKEVSRALQGLRDRINGSLPSW